MGQIRGLVSSAAAGCVLLLLIYATTARAQLVGGQVDDFEDGSVMGWQNFSVVDPQPPPHPGIATNISTGGPAGADDNFLRIGAHGQGGAGGKLVVFNKVQWAGDYLADGIEAIQMQVNLFALTAPPPAVTLRLILVDGSTFQSQGTVNGVTVAPNTGWQTISFPLTDANLNGTGTFASVMSNVTELNLVHSPDFVTVRGAAIPDVAATLGIDNITAVVPEPGAAGVLAAASLALARMRPRRGRTPDGAARDQ